MSKNLIPLTCMFCGKDFEGEEPKTCCNGYECGCGGQPIEPVVCSDECYDAVMNGKHFTPSLIATPGDGAVIVEGVKNCHSCKHYDENGSEQCTTCFKFSNHEPEPLPEGLTYSYEAAKEPAGAEGENANLDICLHMQTYINYEGDERCIMCEEIIRDTDQPIPESNLPSRGIDGNDDGKQWEDYLKTN